MEIRKAIISDIDKVMDIIEDGKIFLRENNIEQWQNGYPNDLVISEDIKKQESYVVLKDNEVVGTFVLSFKGENTYDKIYKGKWLTEGVYGVIHRIAISNSLRGLGIGSEVIKRIEKLCLDNNVQSIKIDTHEDNKFMQKLLIKNGFIRCGIIYLIDGSERIAFEKKF